MTNEMKQDITWAFHAAEDLAVRLELLEAEDTEELHELIKLAWGIAHAIEKPDSPTRD